MPTLPLLALALSLAACGDGGSPPPCSGEGCSPNVADAAPGDYADLDAGSAEPGEDGGDEAGLDAGDGMQAVTIRFKATLGDDDLVCGQNYDSLGTSQAVGTPQDFRFFVQDLRLVRKGSQSEERVLLDVLPPFQRAEVALIDFTDAKGACGGSGGSVVNTTIRGRVPAGEYDGIVFTNGVPETLNHQRLETAAPPLDDVTLNWNWQSGYRFLVAELALVDAGVRRDTGSHHASDARSTHASDAGDAGSTHASDAGDAAAGHDGGGHGDGGNPHGGGGAEAAFVHIGSTGCTGTAASGFSCTRKARNEIRLQGFDPARNHVVADLGAVFETSDLTAPPQCHGIAAACAAPYAALGVDMNSGNPAATQQVFRVE